MGFVSLTVPEPSSGPPLARCSDAALLCHRGEASQPIDRMWRKAIQC